MIIISDYFRFIILHLSLQRQSMNKSLFLFSILVFLSGNVLFSQVFDKPIRKKSLEDPENIAFSMQNDSLNSPGEISVTLSGKTKYTDYKIFSHKRDTTYVDTTLTIQKDYKLII